MNARSAALSDAKVRRVAKIMATLADSFAARDSVLASAGLDHATWARMETECVEWLQEDTSGVLRAIYAESFARAKAGGSARERAPQLHHDPRFLSAAQPWRNEAAAVSIDASGEAPRLLSVAEDDTWSSRRASIATGDLDATAELALGPRKPTLPFVVAGIGGDSAIRRVPAPCRIHEPPIRHARHPSADAENTMEVRLSAPRHAVMPFASSRPPYGRLHRFDTQTGLPLPNPIWIEDAAVDPTKPV
jgi:hypothetical protein